MLDPFTHPLTLWRLSDGKPGHDSQVQGLIEAMQRLQSLRDLPAIRVVDIPLPARSLGLLDWFFRRFPPGFMQPRPDLLVGAGHRTHWPLLCARRAYGGRAVALMTPSLPLSWFDCVVAPAHDERTGANVIVTLGALNPMRPAALKRPGYTVIMVGGASRHFHWDSDGVIHQIEQLVSRHPQLCITDSRRTPEPMRAVLRSKWPVVYQPWETCLPGWLSQELSVAENAWVSEDSVSMIYEALTAGCATGLITVPASNEGRLARGIRMLERMGRVRRIDSQTRPTADAPLAEADRVAGLLMGGLS